MVVVTLLEARKSPGDQTGAIPTDDHTGSGIKTILAETYANSDDWWRSCVEAGIRHLAATGSPFDAFDLTELGVPDPDHPNRWGAAFRAAATGGLIEPIGYRESRRPSRSGGVCRVWRGVPQTSRVGGEDR